MLDIKFVRENPDVVDKSCASRQNAHWDRERFFELDEERRSVIAEVEKLQGRFLLVLARISPVQIRDERS